MSQIKFFFFGPPRVEKAGEVFEIRLNKGKALLAYLLVGAKPYGRDALAAMFWPESDASRGRANLRRTLYRVMQQVGDEVLITTGDAIGRNPDADIWVDVELFRQLSTSPTTMAEAATLYQDSFLAGFSLPDCPTFDEWQFFEGEGLRQSLAQILIELAQTRAAEEEWEQAIAYGRRWLTLDPFHEPAHFLLMRLYALSGQQAAALRQYEECVRILDEELGVEPEEATRALYEAIRSRKVLAQSAAPVASSLPSLPIVTRQQVATPVELVVRDVPAPKPLPVERKSEQQRLPFVGREDVYGHLIGLVDVIQGGRGQVALVEGEPGVGKSRLVAEVLDRFDQREICLLRTKCYEVEQEIPFGVVVDLVSQALATWPSHLFQHVSPLAVAEVTLLVPEMVRRFPELPSLPPTIPEARPSRLFSALAQLLTAPISTSPLLIIVEDVHWLDPPTLQFLHYLLRHIVSMPVLLICTYRPVEAATHATLPATLVTWRQEPYVDYLQLPRLSAEAVGELVSLVLPSHAPVVDLAAWLHDETDGNAFFIACLLQSLQEQAAQVGEIPQVGELSQSGPHVAPNLTLPHALRRTVRQWLGDVPVQYHAVFQMIAAFGRRIDFATLQQLTDTPESELLQILDGLLARHVLDEVENGRYYDFNHDKIREVVYYDLSHTRRRFLHEHIARTIEILAPNQVGLLAEQFEKGESREKAIHYLSRAGDRARRIFALEEGVHYYDRALTLASPDEAPAADPLLASLYRKRGEARAQAGDLTGAVADLELALVAHDQQDVGVERDVHIQLGMALRRSDSLPQAITHLQAGLAAARKSGDSRSVANALYHLGTVHWSRGNNHEALICHQEAVDICRQRELTDVVAVQALHGLGEATFLAGEPAVSIGYYQESLALARELEDRAYEAENLVMIGGAMLGIQGTGEYGAAGAVASQAVELSRSNHLDWHRASALGVLGGAYGLAGRYQEAFEVLEEGLEMAARIGAKRYTSFQLGQRALLWLELNLIERAIEDSRRAVELAVETDSGFWLPRLRANLAIARLRLGDTTVGEELEAALRDTLDRHMEIHAVRCLEGLAEWALVCGNVQQASNYAQQLEVLAERGKMVEMVAQAHRWHGAALLAQGELAEAMKILEYALATACTLSRPRLLWDVHAVLAELYTTLGDEPQAADHHAAVQVLVAQIADNVETPGWRVGLPS